MSQRRPLRTKMLRFLCAAGLVAIATPLVAAPTVVLIGAKQQGMPEGEHDFPDGVLGLEQLIKASPAFNKAGVVVKAYPGGFPKNLAEIDDASTVLLYNGLIDGPNGPTSALQDPAVRQELDKLMARGVGLIAMHQALALPSPNSDVPLLKWLGVARGENDRTMETAPVSIAAPGHPITRGLGAFDFHDEFYTGLKTAPGMTPILTAKLHTQFRGAKATYEDPAKSEPVAWARERPDGGRAFAFSGMHYLSGFDDPNVRKMLLNAILWTAHLEVPASGATAKVAVLAKSGKIEPTPPPTTRVLLTSEEAKPEPQPWGTLVWFASRSLGNSPHVTVGQATILPGQSNPPHWHPNCDEVLHVISGRILNRMGGKEFEMKAGDTVVVPAGMIHNATNIGKDNVVLMISYNSGMRVAIGE